MTRARRSPRLTGGALVSLEGSGHSPHARDPVKVNLLLRDFIQPREPPTSAWTRAAARPQAGALHLLADRPGPRAARRRDRARAAGAACRTCRSTGWPRIRSRACSRPRASASTRPAPSWRTSRRTSSPSRPSTTCTASRRGGEWTRSWSPTSWSSTTSSRPSAYDLWIGDEAWELDYFLHENPELKRAAYCWLTDFVGWLPMPDGGEREAFLTADYNAEMVEHIARFPRLRDRAIFVGNPDDIVPDRLRPGASR